MTDEALDDARPVPRPAVDDALRVPRPAVDDALAAGILSDVYGIDGKLVPLHGERDANFRVDDSAGGRYLLKVHNPADSEDVVGMRTSAMALVRKLDPGLPIPELVPTSSGGASAPVTGPDGRVSHVQLFTFLDGHQPTAEELDERSLRQWGAVVARLGRALRSFFHPAADYRVQWDVRHTPALTDRLNELDETTGRLVRAVIDRFAAHVAPRLPALRFQVVHNDMSRENVLVDDRNAIVAITDFGDMTHTALVCDLAVALADVLAGRSDFVEAARAMIAGYRSVVPIEPEEALVLGDLVAARCATDVTVTTWQLHHLSGTFHSPGPALDLLRQFDRDGFGAVAARLEHAASGVPYVPRRSTDLAAARRATLGPLELSYDEPLHAVRGEGPYLFDDEGRRYLDAYNNVPVVGHAHPAVAAAIAAQARRLVTNTRYLHEASVLLAERLIESAPTGLDRVLFVNSGSEANDLAWRIALAATGNGGGLVTANAYHGITQATTALSPEGWPQGFSPGHVQLVSPPGAPAPGTSAPGTSAPGTSAPGAPDTGATRQGRPSGDVATALARLGASGQRPAVLVVDPAFMSDGVLGPAHAWISSAVGSVRASGGLFVADEVQAGYGRTGESLWSIAPSGVQPDMMVIGKPMGNGFPVAALLAPSALVDGFISATDYFSTFGGNTLACAAALAVLDVIEAEGIVERAARVGRVLRSLLDEIAARHGAVGAVRSWGLVAGIDIVSESGAADRGRASRLVNHLRQLGALVGTTGVAGNVLKVRPPLVVEETHCEELAHLLDAALCADPPG